MRIFHGFDEAVGIKNAVVTTGSFDGVHVGHKVILNRLKNLAQKENGESVLITFYPHPRKVLYPESAGKGLKLINSQEEKLYLLQEAGLDNLIIVEFTREFSRITSEEFISDFLYRILNARIIVAGFNHHFGFNKAGDYKQLWAWREKYNFEAEEIPEQEVQNETVSSTKIRAAISEGYIQRANAYLDHYYIIIGKTEPVDLPEINGFIPVVKLLITEEAKLLPAPGVYAVSVRSNNLLSKGMVIINSISDTDTEVLLHVFDIHSFTVGEDVIIFFHKKVQGSIEPGSAKASDKLNAAKNEIAELIY